MKKIIFTLMVIASIIFVSCNAPTEVKTIQVNGVESVNTYNFNDFFNPEELVYVSRDETSMAIVMDKNTGVIYVWKRSGYQWGHVSYLRFRWFSSDKRKMACKAERKLK